ncbi:hypothetical protein FNYG_11617 [Fusarium nygamai]|uniref:Uncharacterized protein n=1 Tax=Gibberella nygamai TaxID=42673 RepID=A0A2K0VYL7_GIBNY|nr:hypothetical protein FNYG_11617 [Fusarium nygamai]
MSNTCESSKNAAASSQKGSVLQRPANPDTASQMWPTPSPPTITVAMQNHRRMVYHQLQSQLISPEDQEKLLCEWFVRVPDAKEQAAIERTRAFFGKDPYSAPHHSYYISNEVNDDYIRFVIRSGLRRGRISQHDLRQFITERMVPFEESGLRFSLVLIRIKSFLFLERRIPFLFTILGPGGSDPGPRGIRIVAQVTTDGLVDFTELKSGKSAEGTVEEAGDAEQNTYLQEVLKSHYTNCSPYQKEVDQSPVGGVLSKEKPHEDNGRSPVNGETSEENGGEVGGHISPVGDDPSETVDEDDGHGSDDSDDQNTAPTSCGSETGESDYQERRRIIRELYNAVVEQSKRRTRKQLEHMSLKISLCDKLADLKSLAKQMSETEDQIANGKSRI